MPSIVPKKYIRRLETLVKRQAKLRDDMREFEAEIASYAEASDDALDSLGYAISRLSELV